MYARDKLLRVPSRAALSQFSAKIIERVRNCAQFVLQRFEPLLIVKLLASKGSAKANRNNGHPIYLVQSRVFLEHQPGCPGRTHGDGRYPTEQADPSFRKKGFANVGFFSGKRAQKTVDEPEVSVFELTISHQ